jgi:serine/threonine protein kinase
MSDDLKSSDINVTAPRTVFSSREQFYFARELEPIKFLTKGGNAEIWIAHRRNLGTNVAVKFLRPNEEDNPIRTHKARQRLLREGKILATIRHHNVVRILDLSLIGEDPVLILDYILGKSAEELVNGKRLDSRETIIHLLAILDALKECHTNGICHRDISPRNVIIEPSGRAVLIDFGLGYSEELALENRLTSQVQGTRGFIAPELLYDHLIISPTVDSYGIGALGVYMLTGQTPNPTVPLDIPNIPNLLLQALQRAIAPTPERRFQTAEDMAIVLTSILEPQKKSNSAISSLRASIIGDETFFEVLSIEQHASTDKYTKQIVTRFSLALGSLIEQQADDRSYAVLLAAARYRLHDPRYGNPMRCEAEPLLEALGHLIAAMADLAELPPSERLDAAFQNAIKVGWLKVKDIDIWNPSMASGTGHRDFYIPTDLAFRWLRQKTGFDVEPQHS